MDKALAETPETAIETASDLDLNQSSFDAIIRFSEQTEKIGTALDRVRSFFFKRAFNGDFVCHDGKRVNVSGPGAERILSSLGLMNVSWALSNWDKRKDEGVDKNGPWYTHWYYADGRLGNMQMGRLEGRASSRDKLFGFKDGKWKDLADVKEPDIQMAARRCVYKEFVKLGLGLRNIPIEDAIKMGLDEKKIARVDFGKSGETASSAPPAGTPVFIVDVKCFVKKDEEKDGKVVKKGWTRYDVFDDKGGKYSTFSETLADEASQIKASGRRIAVKSHAGKFGLELDGFSEAPIDAKAPAESQPQNNA